MSRLDEIERREMDILLKAMAGDIKPEDALERLRSLNNAALKELQKERQ